jgi:hypothetical protein
MTTPRAFLYIVKATKPDGITCRVPWEVDEQEIFFGPCKKRLREKLRELLGTRESVAPSSPIWLIGFNPSNMAHIGRVLWAGRIKRLMTFSEAYSTLNGPKYKNMRDNKESPLHVRPIMDEDELIGYERRSELHAKNDEWILDLRKSRTGPDVRLRGKQLLIQKGQRAEVFPRDVCAICDNLFFAHVGEGLAVDEALVASLRRAQRIDEIDEYAVFGKRKDGKRDGKRGSYVEVNDGRLVNEIVAWIKKYAQTARSVAAVQDATVCC